MSMASVVGAILAINYHYEVQYFILYNPIKIPLFVVLPYFFTYPDIVLANIW